MTAAVDNLRDVQGWNVSDEYLQSVKNKNNLSTILLNEDVSAFCCQKFSKIPPPIEMMKHSTLPMVTVQLIKARNVSIPKEQDSLIDGEVSSSLTNQRILKLTFSDGIHTCIGVEMEPINGLSSDNLFKGLKIKLTNVPIATNGFLFLNNSNCKVLGGKSDKMLSNRIEVDSTTVRESKLGGAPPFVPFGQKIVGAPVVGKDFKAMTSADPNRKDEAENEMFESARQEIISKVKQEDLKNEQPKQLPTTDVIPDFSKLTLGHKPSASIEAKEARAATKRGRGRGRGRRRRGGDDDDDEEIDPDYIRPSTTAKASIFDFLPDEVVSKAEAEVKVNTFYREAYGGPGQSFSAHPHHQTSYNRPQSAGTFQSRGGRRGGERGGHPNFRGGNNRGEAPSFQSNRGNYQQDNGSSYQGNRGGYHQGNASFQGGRGNHPQGSASHQGNRDNQHQGNASYQGNRGYHHQGNASYQDGRGNHHQDNASSYQGNRGNHHQGNASYQDGRGNHPQDNASSYRGNRGNHPQGNASYQGNRDNHSYDNASSYQGNRGNHHQGNASSSSFQGGRGGRANRGGGSSHPRGQPQPGQRW